MGVRVFTVGHSTHPIDEFVAMLQAHGVQHLFDVRTVPKSRWNPQFNTDALERSVQAVGIGYTHLKSLGGLRKARKDSVNGGWRNESFRGYADHMSSVEFGQGLRVVMEAAGRETVTVMCAEAVPWRCHRSLIADALTVRGVAVEHIMTAASRQPHQMTRFARVSGETVTYPPEQADLFSPP